MVLTQKEMDKMNKEALERRKGTFNVRVISPGRDAELYPGSVDLDITSNGYSWMTFKLMPDEVPKVIEALHRVARQDYLTNRVLDLCDKVDRLVEIAEDEDLQKKDYYAWVVKNTITPSEKVKAELKELELTCGCISCVETRQKQKDSYEKIEIPNNCEECFFVDFAPEVDTERYCNLKKRELPVKGSKNKKPDWCVIKSVEINGEFK
jgi:hypothetical protein